MEGKGHGWCREEHSGQALTGCCRFGCNDCSANTDCYLTTNPLAIHLLPISTNRVGQLLQC